ncbi:MAG: hypothetical protein RLZZ524_3163 [Pseudomonadota bacterium]|jgi:hypothetical protein
MSQLGATAFANLYAAVPDARARVRVGLQVIEQALTPGRANTRAESEQGTYDPVAVEVHVLASAEQATNQMKIGRVIELEHVAAEGWVRLRIAGRKVVGGLLSLSLENPNE